LLILKLWYSISESAEKEEDVQQLRHIQKVRLSVP